MDKKMKWVVYLLLVIGVSFKLETVEAMEVSGTQSGIWNLGGSPYIITATVTVPSGETLVIEPRVEVKFATNTALIVYGTLNASGAERGTITFTSFSSPTPGYWQGVEFNGTNAKGTISHCEISYAKQAVYLKNVWEIVITYNSIHGNKGNDGITGSSGSIGCGIYLLGSKNNLIGTNTISNNVGGQGGAGFDFYSGGAGGIGCGIYLSSSTNNTILGNVISQNTGGQGGGGGFNGDGGIGGIGAGTYLLSSTGNIISGNTISDNTGGQGGSGNGLGMGGIGGVGTGIYLSSSTGNTISGNTTSDNIGGQGGSGGASSSGGIGGVGAGIYLLSSTGNTILDNIISDNIGGQGGPGGGYWGSGGTGGIGVGIYLSSSTGNTISGNTTSDNIGGQGGPGAEAGYEGISGQGYGLYIDSNSYNNTIFPSNTYNGELIHYYYGITTSTTIEYQTLTLAGSGSTNLGRIVLINCSNFTIRYNYIVGGIGENGKVGRPGVPGGIGAAIYLLFSTGNTISNNTILHNIGGQGGAGALGYQGSTGAGGIGTGIYLLFSTGNTISNNTISHNIGGQGGRAGGAYGSSGGIGGVGTGIYLSSSTGNTISGNTTSDNIGGQGGAAGVPCGDGGTGEVGSGIYLISSDDNNITYNTLRYNRGGDPAGNGVGIYCKSSEISPLIYNNIYNNQTYNLQTDGTQTAEYNWWGQHPPATSTFSGNIDYEPWLSEGPPANITLILPISGSVGTIVTISGIDYKVTEVIRIDFGTTQTIVLTSTDSLGQFNTTFTVGTQPYGTKTVKATGLSSGKSAETIFFVIPRIFMITPSLGTVGTLITVEGAGFDATEGICINFGTTPTIAYTTTNFYGAFSAVFTIDTQPYGITTITGRGMVSGNMDRCPFIILPNIGFINPTSGTIGSIVTVMGNGFGATELIRIEFGTTPTITLATTNAFGGFEVIFTVDSQPIGTTTITAYGLMTDIYAQTTFYILPTTLLKITPAIQNIAVNSTFTAYVEIEDVTELRVAELHLSFNPNILQVIEIGTGTFPPEGWVLQNKYDNTKGEIDYSVGLISGSATGSGILCQIKFKAILGGTSSVIFDFDSQHNRMTRLRKPGSIDIPFNTHSALYYVITSISVFPKDKVVKADEVINYNCVAYCSGLELDVTGSTTFTTSGGGSFTLNTFSAYYIGTYTIKGEYLGFIGTTSIIITPGTPTTLHYISGNNQVNTCTFTLKDPFIVKVVDKYNNPCSGVDVEWKIISSPPGSIDYSISPTKTTTNIQGTTSSFLTLGTEPPGTYTIQAISVGLTGSPCTFTAYSLRRFGNIAGFCLLNLGTSTLGTCSDIQVRIVEIGTTTMTNNNSYFFFGKIPVGTYTLTFDTWGASPASKTNIYISPTQFEDTSYIGTMTLLAGDITNDGKVNIDDWPGFVDAYGDYKGNPEGNWERNKEGDFNHDEQVNSLDFEIFGDNFGKQQIKAKIAKLTPMPAKTKKTEGRIELSFNLETLEGVDIDELRVGNIIYLKIYVRDAKDYLGGEIHLSFNPKVLQVIDADNSKDGIQIQPGDFPRGSVKHQADILKNEVDNSSGKIDYAVVVWEPEIDDEGLLATVPFRVISCDVYSKVNFEFDDEENRETKFIERIGQEQSIDQRPAVLDDEITIKVPAVFNNLEGALVYPNPAYKGQEVTFTQITTDKQVTLRIYNIAGELVIEKQKDNINDSQIKWNLKNKDNEDVASGIYIYFLKDELGSVKKGKIGVIK
ncbi:MAG: right-handed parallel beta-helix repeat-containing protein [bacterium]